MKQQVILNLELPGKDHIDWLPAGPITVKDEIAASVLATVSMALDVPHEALMETIKSHSVRASARD